MKSQLQISRIRRQRGQYHENSSLRMKVSVPAMVPATPNATATMSKHMSCCSVTIAMPERPTCACQYRSQVSQTCKKYPHKLSAACESHDHTQGKYQYRADNNMQGTHSADGTRSMHTCTVALGIACSQTTMQSTQQTNKQRDTPEVFQDKATWKVHQSTTVLTCPQSHRLSHSQLWAPTDLIRLLLLTRCHGASPQLKCQPSCLSAFRKQHTAD